MYSLGEPFQDSLGNSLISYAFLTNIIENLAMERGTGVSIYFNKEISLDTYRRFIRYIAIQQVSNYTFSGLAPIELKNFRRDLLSDNPCIQTALEYRQYVLEFDLAAIAEVSSSQWFQTYTCVIDLELQALNHSFNELLGRTHTSSVTQEKVDHMLTLLGLLVVTMDIFLIGIFCIARIKQLAPVHLLSALERTMHLGKSCVCKVSFLRMISLLKLTILAILLILVLPAAEDSYVVVRHLIPIRSNVLLLQTLSVVIRESQLERGLSGAYFINPGEGTLAALQAQFVKTDSSIQAMLEFLVDSVTTLQDSDQFRILFDILTTKLNPHRLYTLSDPGTADVSLFEILDFYYDANAYIVGCFLWDAAFYYADDSRANIARQYLGESNLGLSAIMATAKDFATSELLVGLEVYASQQNSSMASTQNYSISTVAYFFECKSDFCARYTSSVEGQFQHFHALNFFFDAFGLPTYNDSVSIQADSYRADFLANGHANASVRLWLSDRVINYLILAISM
jgi:hypothetical protein